MSLPVLLAPPRSLRSATTIALIAGGGALALVVALDVGGPLRVLLAVAYLLGAPGTALVRWLDVDDAALRASLVLALSLAVDIVVAQALVWAGAMNPVAGVLAVVAVTWAAVAVATLRPPGKDRP